MLDADEMKQINKLLDELRTIRRGHQKIFDILRELIGLRSSIPAPHSSPPAGDRIGENS